MPLNTGGLSWDSPAFPFTQSSVGTLIQGNTFRRCSSNAIVAATTTGTQNGTPVTVLDVDALTIIGNTFEQTYWQGVSVYANRLTMLGNQFKNSGQLGSSSAKFNFGFGARHAIIVGNTSTDDKGRRPSRATSSSTTSSQDRCCRRRRSPCATTSSW